MEGLVNFRDSSTISYAPGLYQSQKVRYKFCMQKLFHIHPTVPQRSPGFIDSRAFASDGSTAVLVRGLLPQLVNVSTIGLSSAYEGT